MRPENVSAQTCSIFHNFHSYLNLIIKITLLSLCDQQIQTVVSFVKPVHIKDLNNHIHLFRTPWYYRRINL